jgi:hypothetical protein
MDTAASSGDRKVDENILFLLSVLLTPKSTENDGIHQNVHR